MNAATPGQARDLQAERDHAEWHGWMDGNGYDFDDDSYQAEAFAAGMQAARDLAAVTGDGTLHSRITRLAETWRSHPQLTEEGQMLRELGEILGGELHYASDRSAEPHPAPGSLPCTVCEETGGPHGVPWPQPKPAAQADLTLASLAADRNQLREALLRIALGNAGDPSVAADKALTASRENARREPALGAMEPKPALELGAVTSDRDRYAEALKRIVDAEPPDAVDKLARNALGWTRVPRPKEPKAAPDPNHEPGLSECGCRDCDPHRHGVAPELAAAMTETRALRALVAEILAAFGPSGSGHTARVGQVQIARWRTRAGLTK